MKESFNFVSNFYHEDENIYEIKKKIIMFINDNQNLFQYSFNLNIK